MKQRPWAITTYWLVQAVFLHIPGPPAEEGPPKPQWYGPIHSITSQENGPKGVPTGSPMEALTQLRSSLPRCV